MIVCFSSFLRDAHEPLRWLHLVVLSGHALPPGIGPGNAQMGQLVAGTAAAGGWQIADGRRRGARGERAGGGQWGDWHALQHALSPPRCEQHACTPVSLP